MGQEPAQDAKTGQELVAVTIEIAPELIEDSDPATLRSLLGEQVYATALRKIGGRS